MTNKAGQSRNWLSDKRPEISWSARRSFILSWVSDASTYGVTFPPINVLPRCFPSGRCNHKLRVRLSSRRRAMFAHKVHKILIGPTRIGLSRMASVTCVPLTSLHRVPRSSMSHSKLSPLFVVINARFMLDHSLTCPMNCVASFTERESSSHLHA